MRKGFKQWLAKQSVTQDRPASHARNAAFIIIDYQPIQVSSIRSMPREELVFNIVSTAKAAVNYELPIIHSTVNVATGRNKPPIRELQDVLGHLPTYDRTSINSWEANFDGFNVEKAAEEAAQKLAKARA